MDKNVLNSLVKTQDLLTLEKHLIYAYLKSNKINFHKSPIITKYFDGFEKNIQLYFDASSLSISNIKELENYLELIIPSSDRKLNGAYFTPDYIIDFVISEIKPKETDTNLDPSCGCGAFLIG